MCGRIAGGVRVINGHHTCHALDCPIEVRPEMLMCRRHWFMIPKTLRDRVLETYRNGQCDDMQPSAEWIAAERAAVDAVAAKERAR